MQNKLFSQTLDLFRNEDSLEDILNTFNEMIALCDRPGTTGLNLFRQIIQNSEFQLNWCKEFKNKIEAKLKQVNSTLVSQYESQSVVIVGAGPGGLVTALECALMGSNCERH
jgi:hypothetical protein